MGVLAAWRDAARVIDQARADACLPCNGREGPCTCAPARRRRKITFRRISREPRQ